MEWDALQRAAPVTSFLPSYADCDTEAAFSYGAFICYGHGA